MAKEINILEPTLSFGTYGIAQCQIEIVEDGVTSSARLYTFNISEFSAFCDSVAVNYGSIHFGRHLVSLSNGDFQKVSYNGGIVANSYLCVAALAQAVGDLT